jgi:glycosyltransferase involved in cell wall biosynthesis
MPHDRMKVVRHIFLHCLVLEKEASVRIAICSYSQGVGNGIARMDEYLLQYLDRSMFSVLYVFIDAKKDGLFERVSPGRIHLSLDIALEKLSDIFRHVDVIQFNGSYDPVVCSAAEIAGKKVVIEVMHNIEPGMMHRNVRHTICVSRTVQRAQLDVGKTSVIYNGVDTQKFVPARIRRYPGKIVVMQPARRDKVMHANLENIAPRIFAHNGNFEFWMVGPGQDKAYDENFSAMKYLGVRADMEELYANADFMLLLSKGDSFGLVAAEAMACGCLPIVSHDGGAAEFVEHLKDGYVVDCSRPEGIVPAILDALDARDDDAMRLAARRKALDMLDIKHSVRRYEQLYADMVSTSCAHEHGGTCLSKELSAMESRMMTVAMFHRHGRSMCELAPIFAKIALSEQVFDPSRLRHPFWGNVLEIVASVAHEIFRDGNKDAVFRFYDKLLSSRIIFPRYLRNWQESSPTPDTCSRIQHALDALGCG